MRRKRVPDGCTYFLFCNNGKLSTITFILVCISLSCYQRSILYRETKFLLGKTTGTVSPLCRVAVASRQCISFSFTVPYVTVPYVRAHFRMIRDLTMTQSGQTTLFSWAGLHFLFPFPWRSHFSPGVPIFDYIVDCWNLTVVSK